ncbi:PLP-dependent aminotransferase family protein [Ruminococcaceae bacterium OttesenSCG-928-O06]|nr:PLP-dependent aminotransferase family protein [Ruminococcaceae bacterium OttesenSCG-928-O06]
MIFLDFVGTFLNKRDKRPLYYQLYNHLAHQIQAGTIAPGEKLPGKRRAAEQLGVSVNTVDEAYQMLATEGYVEAKARSGFVVLPLQQAPAMPPASVAAGEGALATPPSVAPGQDGPWRFSFSSGGLDPELFPLKTWARLQREVLAGPTWLLLRGPGAGDEALRSAIAGYLQGYRGVQCTAGDIVVGAGLEVLTGMLARLFAAEVFALEDPGYPKTGSILRNMGVALRPVAADAKGMDPAALQASGATVAYLTPSHQFPGGGAMGVGRRTELLRWAADGLHYIIEDDHDSEFRFDGRPLPSMQGLDKAGRVVYAGTFTRSLAPGIRAAYLVLPAQLRRQWQQMYGDYACTISRPQQHTLARFISGGHFARNLNRLRAAYRRRRDALLLAVENTFAAGSYLVENAHTGLYFILRLPGRNAVTLAALARTKSIGVRALDEYRSPPPGGPTPTADALVLGYGGLTLEEIPEAAAALWEIVRDGK